LAWAFDVTIWFTVCCGEKWRALGRFTGALEWFTGASGRFIGALEWFIGALGRFIGTPE
jgi:hypothetical protein